MRVGEPDGLLGDARNAPSAGAPPAAAPRAVKRGADPEAEIKSALERIESEQHSYKISTADLLEISVYQEEDLQRRVRVSPKGIITYPLIGRVKVQGLGVAEAEEALTERLKRFVIDPQVSIFITEYGNKKVYVLGEVKQPGSYAMPTEAGLTVIEAITLAGGFTQYASKDMTRVIRKNKVESRTFYIQVTSIMKGGDKSKDLALMPNDVVYVPESFF